MQLRYTMKALKSNNFVLKHKDINTNNKRQSRFANIYVNPNGCVLCKRQAEAMEHLFSSRQYAVTIWNFIRNRPQMVVPFILRWL